MKLARSRNLEFTRVDGTTIVVPPLTRGQWRELLDLDPPDDAVEPAPMVLQRTTARLEVMLRDAVITTRKRKPMKLGKLIDSLFPEEIYQINAAMVAGMYGVLPPDSAAELAGAISSLVKKKISPGS
jgi:hypothetical protein